MEIVEVLVALEGEGRRPGWRLSGSGTSIREAVVVEEKYVAQHRHALHLIFWAAFRIVGTGRRRRGQRGQGVGRRSQRSRGLCGAASRGGGELAWHSCSWDCSGG